uniref:Secreted protein n=1 Tax=Steinernema glaseri TaxID=37863 RepID=A0A1I7Y9U9_9BILA
MMTKESVCNFSFLTLPLMRCIPRYVLQRLAPLLRLHSDTGRPLHFCLYRYPYFGTMRYHCLFLRRHPRSY